MIIKINGNVKPYYVQTLAMVFFPGARFPEDESEDSDTLVATVDVHGVGSEVTADVVLRQGERRCSASSSSGAAHGEAYITGDAERMTKLAVGEAFMKAGVDFTGFTPPWGILTGVRPSKVASELLEHGYDEKSVAEVIEKEYCVSPVKAKLVSNVAVAEKRLITDSARRECSIYIGIPFCPTRCAYCSFVSYTSPKLLKLIPDYLTALGEDVDRVISLIRELGMTVSTVYIGGGTPTILDARQLDALLSHISGNITGLREFTLEAGRPDTITAEKLKVAASHGVDRMSVNPQTLNDEVLCKIGRAHTTDMFYSAYGIAKNSGINNINVDLIAGLPYDTVDSFVRTVDGVIALDPENITVHTFSVKKSSEFKAEGMFDMSSRVASESVAYSQTALSRAGYMPYYMYRQKNTVGNLENVGYAKPGCEGLYNIYMMEEVHSIFSSGASAVTKLVSYPDESGDVTIERLFQPKYPYEYLGTSGDGALGRFGEMRKKALEFFDK